MTTYTVYFQDGGTPKTGLSPTIDIYVKVSDGSSAGAPPSVTELSGGFYKFSSTPAEDIALRVDSNDATMSDSDRYVPMAIRPEDAYIDKQFSGMDANIEIIRKVETGRWKVVNNQMVFYDDDDVTPLLTFDLKDEGGAPTMANVFERDPV